MFLLTAFCLLPTAFRPPEPPGTWPLTPWKQPPVVSRRFQVLYYPLRSLRLSPKWTGVALKGSYPKSVKAERGSEVLPALVRRFVEATERGAAEVACWGDGTPNRGFLYVDDCARGVLAATELYDGGEPVNLGRGQEVRMTELGER